MKKINVLFVVPQMAIGGSEKLILNLARNINRRIFNPAIAWFYGDKALNEFEDLKIPLYHVPKINRFDFSTMRKLGKITKDNNIHIVNAHHFMSMVYSYYGCKIRNNIKLIYTEHSKWEIEQIKLKWRLIGSYLLNNSDGAVGVNAEVTELMKKKFKLDPLDAFIIQNGIDLQAFKGRNSHKEKKRELGISKNDIIVGMVANFRIVKNHIFLLKAFEELTKEHKNVKLLFVGQGFECDSENSEKEVLEFIKKKGLHNHILLLGFRSDVQRLLNMMDIFCLTSLKEGLPISLIEAMGAGLPVVGTDVEGIRDVIVNKKNGFLVSIDDVHGLKNAICSLVQNESLRNKMGRESKAMAAGTYSIETCVSKYQDLFMSVMNK